MSCLYQVVPSAPCLSGHPLLTPVLDAYVDSPAGCDELRQAERKSEHCAYLDPLLADDYADNVSALGLRCTILPAAGVQHTLGNSLPFRDGNGLVAK